jgi:hypothetical protein
LTHLSFGRLTVVGFVLLLPGLYYFLRFFAGFLRVLSRKFRRGKPYLKGSASDYLLFAAGSLLAAVVGGLLVAASMLQSGFQAIPAPRDVGGVSARAPQTGRMRLTFEMASDYPPPQDLSADVVGVRWSLEGESLRWRFGPRWLGFHPGHRIEAVLGSSRAAGDAERDPDARSVVSGSYALSELIRRHPLWLPLVDLQVQRTPWMPAEGSYRIFAGAAGYVLREEEGEKREAR